MMKIYSIDIRDTDSDSDSDSLFQVFAHNNPLLNNNSYKWSLSVRCSNLYFHPYHFDMS